MMTNARFLAVALVAVLLGASLAVAQQIDLKVGDKAPDFTLTGSDGKGYALAQYAGKSYVALCWTRRAGSGGWQQACDSLKAQWNSISHYNVQVFMVACSPLKVTQDEMATGNYAFPMLADEDQATAKAYGTLVPGGGNTCQRWTLLIDDKGTIVAIDKQINGATQGQQLLKMLTDAGLNANAAGAVQSPATPDPQAMTYLERTWTAVTLQLACSDEQQASLKAVYAVELQTRNDALAPAKRDITAVQKALDTCKSNLDAKLKAILTADQWQKMQTLMQPPSSPN